MKTSVFFAWSFVYMTLQNCVYINTVMSYSQNEKLKRKRRKP